MTFGKVRGLTTAKRILLKKRKRFAEGFVGSVTLYGLETWAISKTESFEM